MGIEKDATDIEIRNTYKKLAKVYHPDSRSGYENEDKFIKIKKAYDTLIDSELRRRYDELNDKDTKKWEEFEKKYRENYKDVQSEMADAAGEVLLKRKNEKTHVFQTHLRYQKVFS